MENNLAPGSDDTAVVLFDKNGKVRYLRTFAYEIQKDECQKAYAYVQQICGEGGSYSMGQIELLNLAPEIE
jgi:hypothetical protein